MKKNIITSLTAFAMSASLLLAMSVSLAACGTSTDVSESVESTESTEAIELALADDTETEEAETEEDAEEVEEDTEAIEEDTEALEADSFDAENPADSLEDTEEDVDPLSAYTFTAASGTMYAQSSVNVRSLPDTTGERLGSLSTNQAVTVDAKCNETGWYEIAFGSGTGYVSGKYLGSSQVATTTTTTETAASDDTGTADNGGASDSNGGSSDNGGGSGSSDSGSGSSSNGNSGEQNWVEVPVTVVGHDTATKMENGDYICTFYLSNGQTITSTSNNASVAENHYYIGDVVGYDLVFQ